MSDLKRVVLHTDVVVTELTGNDEHPRLKHYWEDGRIIGPVNAATAVDLVCVLQHSRFGLTEEQANLAAECYLRHCQEVPERPACG